MTGFSWIWHLVPSTCRSRVNSTGPNVFDPGHPGPGPQRLLRQVDIDDGPRPRLGRIERRRHNPQRLMQPSRAPTVGRLLDLLVGGLGVGCCFVGFDERLVYRIWVQHVDPVLGLTVLVLIGVVLMVAQQLEGVGGLGEDADRLGAADVDRVGVAVKAEDVGDPVDGGLEPDRIAGGGAGDDQFQPVLGDPAQPDEPFPRRQLRRRVRPGPVGVVDQPVHQVLQPAPRHGP